MQLLATDIPYLEPLLFWLRQDPNLKAQFTDKSFFMPHADLVAATQEAMQKKDCPAPRALWILPGDTLAQTQEKNGCFSPGVHRFHIQLIVQCIRDSFQLVERDGEVRLSGEFMTLMALRKMVKASVRSFAKDYTFKNFTAAQFEDISWQRDQMIYPQDQGGFLSTAMEYQVTIF